MKRALRLILIFCLYTVYGNGQTVKTVNVTSPGQLSNLVTATEAKTVTTLTLTGNIDARDFVFLRDKLKVLAVLDLTMVSVKAYSGTDGTIAGVLTSYPANELPDYSFYNPVLKTYKQTLTSIKLPSAVTVIGYLAFYYCSNLTGTITIPASVTKIKNYAFYGCSSISSFSVVSSNMKYSSSSGILFSKNQDTLFIFPNTKSGYYTIPNTVKHIGASAFEGNTNLNTVYFPASLNSIGSYAFAGCNFISGNLTLPASLKKIDEGAFYGCANLTGTVSLPATLTDMGNYCFLECNNLSSFSVNEANTTYTSVNDCLFSKNIDTLFICPPGKAGNYTIPESVKLIGSHAFYNCSRITGNIVIPSQVDYIGYYAFYGCKLITGFDVNATNKYFRAQDGVLFSLNTDRLICCPVLKSGNYIIPSSVKSTDPAAFAYCTNLTGNISIPASLTSIGDYTFYDCSQIDGFEVDNSNPRYSSENGVLYTLRHDSLLICPLIKSGLLNISPNVTHIGISAFDGCDKLTEIIMPETTLKIDKYAFEYCTLLSKITIPKKTVEIGSAAFYSCTGLTELNIANPVPPLIDSYTFGLVNKSSCTLNVPVGYKNSFLEAPYWNEFTGINEVTFNSQTEDVSDHKYQIMRNGDVVTITGLEPNEKVYVYLHTGICIACESAKEEMLQIYLPAKGIYLIRTGKKNIKIYL